MCMGLYMTPKMNINKLLPSYCPSNHLPITNIHMAPKKRTAKPANLPKKRARVGAIASGISRAAPGELDIGSMTGLAGSASAPLKVSSIFSDQESANQDSGDTNAEPPVNLPLTVAPVPSPTPGSYVGTFCHFCCDLASSPHKHECVQCGAIICEQHVARGSGCIYLNTVEVAAKDFYCPICSRIVDGKDAPLRYAFIGFGRRKKVKMAWPMAIINLTLESMKDDYLARTVILDAENHFRSFQGNLYTSSLHMRGGAHLSEQKKLVQGVDFIDRNVLLGFPPNIFLVVDTHSDEYTGMLQHTGGHSGGTSTTITEILTAYLGAPFLKAMNASSTAARDNKVVMKTANGKVPWCDLSPSARGGRRGLFMVSCGPAIRVSHHFEAVKTLVQSNMVDFVLAFGGSGTLPSMVSITVRSFIAETGVFGRTDVWTAVCDMLSSSNDFLDYTTAVVVYASTVENKRVVESRQIGKDIPGVRAFGYEFKACATPGCQPAPADMRVHNHGPKVQLRCLKCSWKSSSIRTDIDNKHFTKVNRVLAPQLFWHHFPASTNLQDFFVETTNAANELAAKERAASQNHKGKKGKKNKRQMNIAANIQEDTEMLESKPDVPSMEIDD
ncbi:hypothetical protein DEU56DRAFT_760668 [Suillus clintonianus]|uniref:uncharacterized protein n=1 Tax=Suillus clintonianus TaxID=1904413 RepID=UPI001B86A635|nr:uncharacterized protein DEU56DRAFT_762560 [Suillus clintonianus]XP_041202903.1 uncharacterized protein DEU56DRAFT_760668 [Suillus clintonianus]KAG2108285.1 hypothetical protein DEU56DRAFT_762560 [Suillus clintonianus]KAG2121490.1 hypothetical protein DEU56DRAFT_760668 [Suillus clintonianus]